jgi:hypothetical protein
MSLLPIRAAVALLLSAASVLAGCAGTSPTIDDGVQPTVDQFVAETSASSVLGPEARFAGSPYPDVGLDGLFAVHGPEGCQIAVLEGGEDSFAVRLETLKNARSSIRIQALVF